MLNQLAESRCRLQVVQYLMRSRTKRNGPFNRERPDLGQTWVKPYLVCCFSAWRSTISRVMFSFSKAVFPYTKLRRCSSRCSSVTRTAFAISIRRERLFGITLSIINYKRALRSSPFASDHVLQTYGTLYEIFHLYMLGTSTNVNKRQQTSTNVNKRLQKTCLTSGA